jgi:hypothetical protein
VKGFGYRPITTVEPLTGAGVRKPPGKEPAGMGTCDQAGSVTERLVELAGMAGRGNTRAKSLRQGKNDGEESAPPQRAGMDLE